MYPPSIGKQTPVIRLALSLNKNRTVSVTSRTSSNIKLKRITKPGIAVENNNKTNNVQ